MSISRKSATNIIASTATTGLTASRLDLALAELNSAIGTENLLDRTGTVLSPHTAGDDLDMGTGSVTASTVYGGELTTEILPLRNNAVDNLGFDVEADGVLHSNMATYETLVTSDDDIPNKKYVDDEIGQTVEATLSPTGFPIDSTTGEVERDDSELSWTNGTNTFTIQPKAPATSFDIYVHGKKFTYDSAQTKVITPAQGVWYFYFDTSGVLQSTQTFSKLLFSLGYVGYGYYDAAVANDMLFGDIFDERHGCGLDTDSHYDHHFDKGMRFQSGLALNTLSVDQDGSLAAHAQFGIDLGVTYDEDIKFDIDAVGSTAGLPILYHNAAGNWISTTEAGFAVKTTGTGRLAYNPSGSGLVEVTNGDFVLCHIFATAGDGSDKKGRLVSIVGQTEYTKAKEAREGATLEINNLILGDLPTEEFKFFATVIFQTADAYTNSINARVISTDLGDNYEDFRFSGITASGAGVTSHSNLSDLDKDNHEHYALLAGRSGGQTLIGGTDSGDDLTLQTTSNVTKGSYILSELTTAGGLVKTDANGVLSQLADVAVNQVLVSGGVGVDPAYSATPTVTDITATGTATIGSTGEAGVADLKDSSNVSKVHFDTEGDSYITGGDTGFGVTTPSTKVEIETAADEGDAALTIDQNDVDEPFINFEGTSAADQANNISTVNGDGTVEGPKNYSSTAGWAYEGMIRVNVGGTDYWMPYYSADLS